jgi:Lsr2
VAQRVVRTDDLDGSEAAETITYTVNGQDYEIDLSEENAQRFYDTFVNTSKEAAALSVRLRPHDAAEEMDGGEVAAADGMTSRKSVPGLRPMAMR